MVFSELLGLQLKSDRISEILEVYDLETTYDFDRLHENTEDTYWVKATEQGFLLRFNQDQILDTVFLYVVESEGIRSIAPSEVEVEMPRSLVDAKAYFEGKGIKYEFRDGIQTVLGKKWWIKGDLGKLYLHYEYKDDRLFRITIMTKN